MADIGPSTGESDDNGSDAAAPGTDLWSMPGEADKEFLDNLLAANHFKTFLVGRGNELPKELTLGIATLMSTFESDLDWYKRAERERRENLPSKKWWQFGG